MLYRLGKKVFEYLINFVKFTQVSLIFLSFATTLYWILEIAKVPFIAAVAPFFNAIEDFVHVFYNRQSVIDNVSIDFSFFIAALSMLLIVWLLKFVVEAIEFLEIRYDSLHKTLKNKAEASFNVNLENQYVSQESKNNKLIIFVKFNVKNIAKDRFFDRDANAGVEGKQKEVLFDFYSILDEDFDCQKKLSNGGVFLYFEKFEDVDSIISSLENILSGLIKNYFREKWQIDFFMSLDAYASTRDLTKETEKLLLLISLGLENKITCLSTFKQRYSLVKKPNYLIAGQGFYKILENEDVYCVERLK